MKTNSYQHMNAKCRKGRSDKKKHKMSEEEAVCSCCTLRSFLKANLTMSLTCLKSSTVFSQFQGSAHKLLGIEYGVPFLLSSVFTVPTHSYTPPGPSGPCVTFSRKPSLMTLALNLPSTGVLIESWVYFSHSS